MKFLLKGLAGEEIASNLLPQCVSCFASVTDGVTAKKQCPVDKQHRRVGVARSPVGSICLCSPIQDDVNSSRVFRSRMAAHLSALDFVSQMRREFAASYNQQLDRVTHNLTSLNAHCIQEVFDLVSQETLTKNISQQMKFVQDAMKASPQKAAKTFLRIAKNNLAMKLEFVAMRFLDSTAPHPAFREHQIKQVVMNVLHAFFQDFTDLDVRVAVEESPATVLLDYDTFHVALYHVIDNATKYVMPHSEVHVRFNTEDGRVNVVFDMMSLPIPRDELGRIGEEGFSGQLARHLQLSGHGMGMFRTKRLLAVNDGELSIRPNATPAKDTTHNGIQYQHNVFVISLMESQRRRRTTSGTVRR